MRGLHGPPLRRAGRLVMDDEAEIGLVIAHPERAGGDDRLDVVGEQPGLGGHARLAVLVAAVGQRADPGVGQELGDLLSVTLGERVDDPRAAQAGHVLRQPGQPRGRLGKGHHLQSQACAGQRAPVGAQGGAARRQLLGDVGDDAVVRGRGRGEHRGVVTQRRQHVPHAAVVGAEIVPPVGDAVGLVDDQQPDRPCEQRQHRLAKARIVQPLGADQQQIEGVLGQGGADLVPLLTVGRIDGVGAQPQARGGGELVAHEREQRGDDQRRTGGRAGGGVAQQRGGDEVDRRLAPAGPLHAQHAGAVSDDVGDRLQLVVTELRSRVAGEGAQTSAGPVGEGVHGLQSHQTILTRPPVTLLAHPDHRLGCDGGDPQERPARRPKPTT
jgi:hypothetical protein